MAANNNITSADAVLVLTVEDLYPAGLVLQQFSADSAASMDTVTIGETRMGVDGFLVGGYTPAEYPITINLEASSPSYEAMVLIWQNQLKKKKLYECTLTATLPAIGRSYTWKKGFMVEGTPLPSINRTLDPTAWTFHFQDFEVTKSA